MAVYRTANTRRIAGTPAVDVKAFPQANGAPSFVSIAIGEEHVGYYTLIIPDLERVRAIGRALIEAADLAEAKS